ncbi:MAG: EAL domain-containing protein [Desulfovibrio sp.]
MKIRLKTFSVLVLIAVSIFSFVFFATRYYLNRTFNAVELAEINRELKQVDQIIQHESDYIQALTKDWAYWDDMYDYVANPVGDYLERQLPISIYDEQNLQFIGIYDETGGCLYEHMYSPLTGKISPPSDSFREYLKPDSRLLSTDGTGFHGVLALEEGIMILSAEPIRHSKKANSNGVIVFGRFFTEQILESMRLRSGVDFSLISIHALHESDQYATIFQQMVQEISFNKVVESGDRLNAYTIYSNLFGDPEFLVEVKMKRALLMQGHKLFKYNFSVVVLVIIAGGILLILFLEFHMLARVTHISAGVRKFADDPEQDVDILVSGKDEISAIAQNINAMILSLKDNQSFLTQILSSIDTGVLLIDPETRTIVQANIAAARLIGVAPDKLIGADCQQFTCFEEGSLCPITDQGFSGNVSITTFKNINGTNTYTVLRSITTIQKEGKKFILESFTDISDLEKTRLSLEMSEATYRAIFNNTGNATILLDADTTIQLANHQFEKLSGWSREDLEGKVSWTKFVHPDDLDMLINNHAKRRTDEDVPGDYSTRFVNAAGEVKHVSLTVALLPDKTRSIASLRDITKNKQDEKLLEYQAYHDILTNLPNRLSLQRSLSEAVTRAFDQKKTIGVMLLDLDRFKNYNDSFGHEFGDEILKAVSKRLAKLELGHMTMGRLGGDEFLFILEDLIDQKSLIISAEQILRVVEKPLLIQKRDIYLGGSIGIAVYPEDGTTAEDLIKNADLAMYQSKERGKNTFTLYTKDLDKHMIERLTIETNLRNAIENGEIVAYYQPIIDTRTGRVWGVEALARWFKNGEMISPADFIPVAEETNLVIPLDKHVLEQGCRDLSMLANEGFGELNLSVNYSANHFKKGDISSDITTILIHNNFQSSKLYVELTETALMENLDMAMETLADVRASGVKVVLDDFGTGYSSLQYLQKLDIQALKIDRSFIQSLKDPYDDSTQLVKTIVSMAKGLDLQIVAEGVETQDQYEFVKNERCERAQGFLLAKPMPLEKLTEFLKESKK